MNHIWYYRDLSKLTGICNSYAFMKILCIKYEASLNCMFVYCNIVTLHIYHNANVETVGEKYIFFQISMEKLVDDFIEFL